MTKSTLNNNHTMTIEEFQQLVRSHIDKITGFINCSVVDENKEAMEKFLSVLKDAQTDAPQVVAPLISFIASLDLMANVIKAYQQKLLKDLDNERLKSLKEFAENIFAGKHLKLIVKEEVQ